MDSRKPMYKDHEHAGFSWYLSDKPGIFNPYNVSDRISRKTWYDNVTYPDKKSQERLFARTVITKLCGPHDLFTRLSCPQCNQR